MHPGLRLLVASALVIILVCFPQIHRALQVAHLPSAYAVRGGLDPAGRVYQGDNDEDDNDAR